jgi:hypothetical protein
VVDTDYGVWNVFANHYWPALYFADAEGRVRHHRFGEGDYERSEIVIQQLLGDVGADVSGESLISVDPSGPEVTADWGALNTPETYLGYRQTENFASPGGMERDAPKNYEAPQRIRHNPLGALRRLDRDGRSDRPERAQGPGRVPVRRPRRAPGDGTRRWCIGAVLRVDRRRAAGCRRWEPMSTPMDPAN